MTTRVGINGFGRIGRTFTRLALGRTDLEVVVSTTSPTQGRWHTCWPSTPPTAA